MSKNCIQKGKSREDASLETVDGALETVDAGLETVDGRVETVDAGLERVDARVETVNAGLERVDARVETEDARLEMVDSWLERGFYSPVCAEGAAVRVEGTAVFATGVSFLVGAALEPLRGSRGYKSPAPARRSALILSINNN